MEFWETEPGSVLMIQKWDETSGDQRLELGPAFRRADGSFGNLYRQLLNDPNAALSPEMVAADERIAHLPIRDGSLPRPTVGAAPFPPHSLGEKLSDVTPPTLVPSTGSATTFAPPTVSPKLARIGGGIAPGPSADFCNDPEVEGSWCPAGTFANSIAGAAQEVMFFDAMGHNPQASGGGNDQFVVNRIWSNGGHTTDFSYGLAPGHSVETYYAGTAATYQGAITGTRVSYAEKWRLSFPSLSTSYNYPEFSTDTGTFSNDIEGIAHLYGASPKGNPTTNPSKTLWVQSRTQYTDIFDTVLGGFKHQSLHGQIGLSGELGFKEPNTNPDCTIDEPADWQGLGYAHYGDISIGPIHTPGATDRSGLPFVLVSLNDANNHNGAVGFLGLRQDISAQCDARLDDWGTVAVSATEQAPCLAIMNKYHGHTPAGGVLEDNYTTHVYVPSSNSWEYFHTYQINYAGQPFLVNQTLANGSTSVSQDVHIINANWSLQLVDGPNGMKISKLGKLYVWASGQTSDQKGVSGRLFGIDPFTGMVQMYYDISYGMGSESEGLDIIETTDVNLQRSAPEILVQILQSNVSTDRWEGVHLVPDDPSRL